MPSVIFRARSPERSQLPLPGRFLSRRWFALCITIAVERRIRKEYMCHYLRFCQNYNGKVVEDGRKVSLHRFPADQITSALEKVRLWAAYSASSKLLLAARLRLWAFKNASKVVTVNFATSPSPPSIVKKVRTGSKNSQRNLAMPGKSQGR